MSSTKNIRCGADEFRGPDKSHQHLRPDAIYAEMRQQQGQVDASAAEFMKDTPMYQLYHKVAPRPDDFGRPLDKIGETMAKDFDYSDVIAAMHSSSAPASPYSPATIWLPM